MDLAIVFVGILALSSSAFAQCMANGYGCNARQQQIMQNLQNQQQQINQMQDTANSALQQIQGIIQQDNQSTDNQNDGSNTNN
jgi:protein-disulfide isomerase